MQRMALAKDPLLDRTDTGSMGGEVIWLTEDIRRIIAPNPSPMTHAGTNSYLVGRGEGVVLIDPGPNSAQHVAHILQALQPDEKIAAIVVTHAHSDHSGAVPLLAAKTKAPVHAYGPAIRGRSAAMQNLADQGFSTGGEGIDPDFTPDVQLEDGGLIPCAGGDLQVIHTPGHLSNHICLARDGILFSGDHAMGWSSSIVSPPDGDMGAYIASLRKLRQHKWRALLPGHGPVTLDADDCLERLLQHRLHREAEIIEILRDGPASAAQITARIYREIPPYLHAAAERNVLAHLIDLTERLEISCEDPIKIGAAYTIRNFPA